MALSSAIARKCFSSSAAMAKQISTITVIGSGLMGAGVAQVAAQAGQSVHLVDVRDKVLPDAEKRITHSLQLLAKKKYKDDTVAVSSFIQNALEKITLGTDTEGAVNQSDLVVEAIIENIDIKQKLFAKLDEVAPAHTIFVSNTSSLPIGEIASKTKRRDRFAGTHFFNPVPVMKLVEVVALPETSEETIKTVLKWGEDIGKTCIRCKDTPGFIVNRLLIPYVCEAVRMLERGDASAADIDTGMKLGAGHFIGPLAMTDMIGLDTTYYILKGWSERFPDNPLFENIELVEKMFKDGKLGRKSGEGFYKYH